MDKLEFRPLKAEEIEVRIASISQDGITLLLYKDSRADMRLLDETVGPMNWQRRHSRDNANCIVSIWDAAKGCWVEKEDTGTESNQEKEKGLASDSFKRACTNWGCGRELYTAPIIWIPLALANVYRSNGGKPTCKDRFVVEKIAYDAEQNIVSLSIKNVTNGKRVFLMINNEIKRVV